MASAITANALEGLGIELGEDALEVGFLGIVACAHRSDLNKEIPFYLRVPKNYRPGKSYRLLFLCPNLNEEGLKKLAGSAPWLTLADERDWFVMSCTFKQANDAPQNWKEFYYYPESFSGKATLEALELISKKYPVISERLLMQGALGMGAVRPPLRDVAARSSVGGGREFIKLVRCAEHPLQPSGVAGDDW